MKKDDLITQVSCETGKSFYETKIFVTATIEQMTKELQRGGEIKLNGFGTFKVKKRAPRSVRNISTGEQYVIASTRKVVFEPGKNLKLQ